jgi:hypothetical protein
VWRSTVVAFAIAGACGESARDRLDRILRETGAELVLASDTEHELKTAACAVTKAPNCVRCKLASAADLAARELAEALEAAPVSFLKIAALKRVAVCAELEYLGDHGDAPPATIDLSRGMLLVRHDAVTRGVVQHEIYHLFDARVPSKDAPWHALNPRGFRYGQRASDGFARAYGMTSIREDKATVYEAVIKRELCTHPEPIVIAKAKLVRTRIRDVIGDDAAFVDELAPCLQR